MSKTFKKLPKNRRFDDYNDYDDDRSGRLKREQDRKERRQERALRVKDIDSLTEDDECQATHY